MMMNFKRYIDDIRAVAAVETALLFPVLITLMMGVFDIGQGVLANQKIISASQIVGDLVARNEEVEQSLVDDIAIAGEMALGLFAAANNSYGYDVVSIEYDEDDDPVVLWRVTDNMDENASALSRAEDLGVEGDGVIIVSVKYDYEPFFTNFLAGQINMTEVAVLRGRKSAIITCDDC